jgi:predicted transposase/invertase (TIGR01784 family)
MLKVSSFRQTKVYQEAFREGREETAETIARRLLTEGFPIEKIARVTGLSVAAIKRLKKKDTK